MRKTDSIQVTSGARQVLDFTCDKQDEELVKKIINMMCEQEINVDRASRILADAQKMLPFVDKLVSGNRKGSPCPKGAPGDKGAPKSGGDNLEKYLTEKL